MKIAIVEPNAHLAGHYSAELYDFCRFLVPHVEHIDIITPFGFKENLGEVSSPPKADQLQRSPSRPMANCKVHALLNERKIRPDRHEMNHKPYGFQWEFYKRAAGLFSLLRPDIVHVWGYKSVFPLWYFLRKKKVKSKIVMTLKAVKRAHFPVLGLRVLGALQGEFSYRFLKKFADCYVVHTDELRDQAAEIGIENTKLKVIPTGIHEHHSLLTKEESRCRLKIPLGLGLPSDAFLLLLFGALREEKGICEILEHAKTLPENVYLYLVGEDWTHDGISSLVKSHEVETKVVLHLHYIPEKEMELYFRASDAVIISHQPEFVGESGVLLRAMEYGIPVIAANHGYSGRVVRSGNIPKGSSIGVTFDLNSAASFNEAVLELMKRVQPKADQSLAEKKKNSAMCDGIAKFKAQHNWEEIIQLYLGVYERI